MFSKRRGGSQSQAFPIQNSPCGSRARADSTSRAPRSIPHGDSVVRDGDHVIVFCVPENVEAVLGVFRADEEGK